MSDTPQAATPALPLPDLAPAAVESIDPVLDPVEGQYQELAKQVHQLRPNDDLAPLERAYRYARERHREQKRFSGEPYMIHPIQVTRQLASMNMDMVCLETGL